MRDRVLFLDRKDMLFGYQLDRIESMDIPEFENIDINYAIEFYEIKRYFDAGIHLKTWTETSYQEYERKSKTLYGLTMRFINNIDDDSIIKHYAAVDTLYHASFWQLFCICKLHKKISNNAFARLIQSDHISSFDLFEHKEVVTSYGPELRDYILTNVNHIQLIIHVYEQDFTPGKKLFLPDELTGEDICGYISQYVASQNVNPNHLEAIRLMRATVQIPITDEIRLAAKRRYQEEAEKMTSNGTLITSGVGVILSPDQEEVKKYEQNGNDYTCSYSNKWLKDTLDYPSILNNFIYVFEFVDVPQMRSLQVHTRTQSGVFGRVFQSQSSRMYPDSFGFKSVQNMCNLQMNAYYEFLNANEICLEEVLQWVFTQYLQEEFCFPEMRVRFPSKGTTYSEKCSTIITAFESILKQYCLYVKHGAIDFELMAMSSASVKFDMVPSLLKKKYIYGKGNDYKSLTYLMFSDQCMLSFVPRIYETGKRYDCFLELIRHETIYMSDYQERDIPALRYLAEHGLICISVDGIITLCDTRRVALLRDLYQHDAINISHYNRDVSPIITEWEKEGIVCGNNTLFSEPDVNYLNYLLNRAEYDNGLEIRNRYAHGVLQIDPDEAVHKRNYIILLRVLVLLAIKINDELCTLNPIEPIQP